MSNKNPLDGCLVDADKLKQKYGIDIVELIKKEGVEAVAKWIVNEFGNGNTAISKLSDIPHTIKVSGCEGCPFWDDNYDPDKIGCKHPCQYYDGNKVEEFIEHCPLKERQTVVIFDKPKSNMLQKLIAGSIPSDWSETIQKREELKSHAISFANFLELHPNYNQSAATRAFGYEIFTGHILKET